MGRSSGHRIGSSLLGVALAASLTGCASGAPVVVGADTSTATAHADGADDRPAEGVACRPETLVDGGALGVTPQEVVELNAAQFRTQTSEAASATGTLRGELLAHAFAALAGESADERTEGRTRVVIAEAAEKPLGEVGVSLRSLDGGWQIESFWFEVTEEAVCAELEREAAAL